MMALPAAPWAGVDEAVIGRFAAAAGRAATPSFISGDLLLFAFLVAGVVAGFVLGYGYRALFSRPQGKS